MLKYFDADHEHLEIILLLLHAYLQLLGKKGRVTEVDPEGDVMIKFGQRVIKFNPECLEPASGDVDNLEEGSPPPEPRPLKQPSPEPQANQRQGSTATPQGRGPNAVTQGRNPPTTPQTRNPPATSQTRNLAETQQERNVPEPPLEPNGKEGTLLFT